MEIEREATINFAIPRQKARQIRGGFRKIAGVAHVTYDKCFAGDIPAGSSIFNVQPPRPHPRHFPISFAFL